MGAVAEKVYTVEDARTQLSIMRVRMQLMANAMVNALTEAEGARPGACERVAQILRTARQEYLDRLRGGQ